MTKRLTLELSEDAYEVLEGLAKKTKKTQAAILREGLGLRQFAQQLESQGKSLASVTEDDEIDTKVLLT